MAMASILKVFFMKKNEGKGQKVLGEVKDERSGSKSA